VAATNTRAARYAEAAFGVARRQGQLDDWVTALDRAAALLEDRQAEQFLTSPVVPPDRKIAALGELLPDVPPMVRNFLEILARRARLGLLGEIAAQFHRRVDAERGVAVARVTTAVPLDADQQALVGTRLAARFGKQVTIETNVDPSILGGVVAQVGDEVIDGSVRGRLERLRRSLMA
jgi:F-type H+-transporting ATPase subunit delta